MKLPTLLRSALAALLSGLALGAAHAQPSTAAAPDKAVTEADQETQRIIVTANRRREEAQKVSGVVQSISGEQLRKDGVTELRSLQQVIPGMNIANQEGNLEIFIRGVGSANNTELGDPGAAPHINGIYIPRPRGLGLMFFDLERVEVNKGPQGTLYGRNALAGTLNIITAKPKLGQFGGYAQAELASRNGLGGEGAVNVPLGETMALRAAVNYVEKDSGFKNHTAAVLASGEVTNVTPQLQAAAALRPAGLEKNYAARLSYLWDITEKMRFTAMVDGGKEMGTGYPGANIHEASRESRPGVVDGVRVIDNPGGLRAEDLDLRKIVYRGAQGEMSNELRGLQAKIDYDLGAGITAEFSSSYRTVDFYQRNASSESIDYPGRNYNGVQFDNFSTVFWQTKSKSTTNELRLFSDDAKARVNWSAGLFRFNEDQEVGFFSLADRGYCCYSGTEFTMPEVNGKSTALFADGSFKVTDSLRALGGIRFTKESKYRYGIGGNIAGAFGGDGGACCFGSRFGTEGYVPALLGRPNFDLSAFYGPDGRLLPLDTPELRRLAAQLITQGVRVPGARDTLLPQIAPILTDGLNGACIDRPDTDNGFVQCAPGDTHSFAGLTIPEQQIGRSKASYTDFRAGLEFDITKDNMVYGKVSTAHKAGGFNDSFQATGSLIPEVFKPEKLVVLEAGMRNAFSLGGRRALANVTGFYYDYKDQVFQDLTCIAFDSSSGTPRCSGYSLVNRNIGASKVAGLELEFKLPLTSSINFDLNTTFLKTRITKGVLSDYRAQDFDQPPVVDGETFGNGRTPFISVVGNELPLASKINVATRLQHAFELGAGKFDWQVMVNYRSSYYLTPFNELPVDFLRPGKQDLTAQQAGFPDKQKGFATVNLGIGYTLDGLRLEAFAANLTNEQASQKAIVGNNINVRFLNDARTYGMRVRASF